MPFKTYYERLGVAADASQDDIKTAYRKLAQELHPDKLPDDISPKMEELAKKEFNELREAYLVLSNSSARATYDRRLVEQAELNAASPVPTRKDSSASDRIPKRWRIPLAAAAIGAACAVIVVSLINAVASINRQPTPQANSAAPPPSIVAADTETTNAAAATVSASDDTTAINELAANNPVETAGSPDTNRNDVDSSDDSGADAPGAIAARTEAEFTPGEITRFATALLELQPILNLTKVNLEAANSPIERKEIENEFDVRATEILLSHGLRPDEYQRIAARTETDSQVRLEVIAATVRLQQLGRYQ
ncbi:MAG: DnaJ domain-containing protein [Cyanobacteria bacterium P01_A01_bin.3]